MNTKEDGQGVLRSVVLALLRLQVEADIECKHQALPAVILHVPNARMCELLRLLLRTVSPKSDAKPVKFGQVAALLDLLGGHDNLQESD